MKSLQITHITPQHFPYSLSFSSKTSSGRWYSTTQHQRTWILKTFSHLFATLLFCKQTTIIKQTPSSTPFTHTKTTNNNNNNTERRRQKCVKLFRCVSIVSAARSASSASRRRLKSRIDPPIRTGRRAHPPGTWETNYCAMQGVISETGTVKSFCNYIHILICGGIFGKENTFLNLLRKIGINGGALAVLGAIWNSKETIFLYTTIFFFFLFSSHLI